MTKETSREAYRELLESGKLSERLEQVLWALEKEGPGNRTMVWMRVNKRTDKLIPIDSISPRFAVLERMGMVRQAGIKPCPQTRRNTIWWERTETIKPLMPASEANKAVGMLRQRNRESVTTLAERIRILDKRLNRLEAHLGTLKTGQMEF